MNKTKNLKQVSQQFRINQVAEAKLSYLPTMATPNKISRSSDAVNIFQNNWPDGITFKESFMCMLLDRSNKVKGIIKISEGGLIGTVVDTRIILTAALLSLSSSIIVAHNHPSGNAKPSQADIQMTNKIKHAAILIDVTLLDHVIITHEGDYCSLADEGLM